MSRNVDGEFEMVLGNKQLLSLFFLVVVLFAVFFSLGYMVGRSVGPGTTQAAQPPATAEPASSPSSSPSPLQPPAPERAEASLGGAEQTQPARGEPSPASSDAPAAAPAPPVEVQPPPAMVARDMHLQIAAVRVRQDADALAQTLVKKGYRAQVNGDTRDGWYRVVLGPFPSEKAAQDMKTQLGRDGFGAILKRP